MTDEPNDAPEPTPETDFAAFEAAANAEPADEPRDDDAPAEVNDKGEEPLELTDEVKPEGEDDEGEDGEPKKATRNMRWSTRVNALTAKLREAEARAIAAEQKAGIETKDAETEAPNPERYEFGEADPEYLKALARHEVGTVLAEERGKAAKEAALDAARAKVDHGIAMVEDAGKEKYPDFEEKVTAAFGARGNAPLPPLLGAGLAVSPVGHDITYRLVTDDALSDELEALAQAHPMAAAERFGELEGEYLATDADLDLSDPYDMARWRGRRFSRRMGAKAPDKPTVKATEAPEPPGHRIRGGGGQFETTADTTDFAKFEKLAKKAAG